MKRWAARSNSASTIIGQKRKKLLVGAAILLFPIGVPILIYNKIKKRKRRQRQGPRPSPAATRTYLKTSRGIDLGEKLWGGFSTEAIAALEQKIAAGSQKKQEYIDASQLLVRWYAANFDWHRASEIYLRHPKTSLSPQLQLIGIEALSRAHLFDEAEKEIISADGTVSRENLLLAKSNYAGFRDGLSSTESKLELFNDLITSFELEPIALADPRAGLAFDNISCNPNKMVTVGPKVSILVPAHNSQETLSQAISSLLKQTWQNIEVIVIDDASTDRTWELAQQISASDNRVKCFQNQTNLGAYSTRNRALSLSTGEFVTVHDADDWSHPEMIERQVKPLLEKSDARATFSSTVRLTSEFVYALRPQRPQPEYIHRAYPSFLCRLADIQELGEWDNVTCNADDEMVDRFRCKWGRASILDVLPNAPMTLQLLHENSLTQTKETSLNSLTFGLRREYRRQAAYWLEKKTSDKNLALTRNSFKDPFPIPQRMARKDWPRNTHYDLVIISDLGLLGGTRRCNEGYINAAIAMGWRVGIFNWPYFPFAAKEVAETYLDLSYHENVDILVPEDHVNCGLLLIHHPPIMSFRLDAVPTIEAENVAMLVNQCPMQLRSEKPHLYDMQHVDERCLQLFGAKPEWISISKRTQDILTSVNNHVRHYPKIWHPPYNGELPEECPAKSVDPNAITIGRHSRDHWTKWPEGHAEIRSAYYVSSKSVKVHLLGGAEAAFKVLGSKPKNWRVFEFDSIRVSDFLRELDFFVNFVHSDYIEEFGRNIMEAMAAGIVAILSPDFERVFGEAAVYCAPEDVPAVVAKFSTDPARYRQQATKGFEYVRTNCAREKVQENLRSIVSNKASKYATI